MCDPQIGGPNNKFQDCFCESDCSILVLNTFSSPYSNPPLLVNYDGGNNTNMEFFIRQDTDIYLSCSARLNGEYYVFGGNQRTPYTSFTKQISKINDCRLKRVGDLPFDFEYGACGTYEVSSEERVMLCFDMNEQRKCRRYWEILRNSESEFPSDSPLIHLIQLQWFWLRYSSRFGMAPYPYNAWKCK